MTPVKTQEEIIQAMILNEEIYPLVRSPKSRDLTQLAMENSLNSTEETQGEFDASE